MSSPTSFLKSKIIQAGAGAGKTTRLIQTFIEFAKQYKIDNGRYPRIVVTTFTKKATQELRERLMAKAYQLNDTDLVRWLGLPSQVHISTIHGILVPFLSRYGSACGLNPEVRIISQLDQNKLYRKILKKILVSKPDYLEILEEFNWSELVVSLIAFHNKKMQFGNLSIDSSNDIKLWSEAEFKKWNEKRQNLQNQFQGISLTESWNLYLLDFFRHLNDWKDVQAWLDLMGRKPPFKSDKPAFSIDLHENLIALKDLAEKRVSQPLIFESNWPRFDQVQNLFYEIANLFSNQLLEIQFNTGNLSLSDLENLSLEVIRRDSSVAKSFSKDWDFWMIDEYQDTAPVQVQLLTAFIQNTPHFVVGDPQQSIYLFRGARTEVFKNKVQELASQQQVFEKMNSNYRSSYELVQFFNQLFTQFSDQFMEMKAHQSPGTDNYKSVQISVVPESDELEDSEVSTVLAQVQKLIESGVKPSSIAILSRNNSKLKLCLKVAQKYQIDLESPNLSDFWKRREILDLIFLTRFLINPHNNINYFGLLRSPCFYVADDVLMTLKSTNSIWLASLQSHHHDIIKVVAKLKMLLEVADSWGISQALYQFLNDSEFLYTSQLIDSTGRRESNIWKFLTELRMKEKQPGLNLLEYMDEILLGENNDVDALTQEAPPLQEPNRVHLMTIHASKGLEFDHVFLIGLGHESALSQNQQFCFDETVHKISVAIRDNDGKWMYSPLSEKIRDQLREREREESYRVLYVALTRAKKSLNLSTKQDFKKNSWWGQWPLSKEVGDHKLYSVQTIQLTPQFVSKNENIHFEKLIPIQCELPASLIKKSVTQVLEESKSSVIHSNINQNKVEALKKAQLGTYLHRIFESLVVKRDLKEIDEKWQTAVQFLLNLKSPPMQEILDNGFPEWGFAVQMDDYLLQGTIDLWADLDQAVYILDYKTGSSSYSESAIEQMKIYSEALKKMRVIDPQKKIFLAALYPLEQRVVVKEF